MDAVVIANPKTEIYNPNIINSSLGSIFTLQIGVGSTKEVIDFLLKNNIKIYSTFIKDSVDYLKVKYGKACAVVIGTESNSLTNVWKSPTTELIKIPMKGKMDSLNLSVSAAIVIFEVLKQRNAI
jgi:TrmH family RNA methyltransferase